MIAYHFVGATLRDGRPVPADGEWLAHEGPIILCESGLHASLTPWRALGYAPGAVLCRVEVDGDVVQDLDKIVGRRRRILARVDLTDVLWAFARAEALRVIHLWDAPDVVRQYLETGDETLRDAAWDAAGDAARGAARDAARGAARGAAWAAAWAAARATAWDAARGAAWDAAGDASGDAAGERFNAPALAALEGR